MKDTTGFPLMQVCYKEITIFDQCLASLFI